MSDVSKCILCNNLVAKNFYVDSKLYQCAACSKNKFVIDGADHYFTLGSVQKDIKDLKEIEDKCDAWDYRLKGNNEK